MNINETVKEAFVDTMRREGRTINMLNNNSFRGFFRKNSDGLNERSSLVLYYLASAPVHAGSILSYGGENLIAINKETAENEVYYKSALLKCNGILTTNDYKVEGLPFYVDSNIKSATPDDNKNYTFVDGHIEAITEDCDQSRELAIDDTFNAFGRTFKIDNLYFVDGVAHVVAEVTANEAPVEPTYTVHIDGLTMLNVVPHEVTQLTATAYRNDKAVNNATITWTCSNPAVASIDADGHVQYLSEGLVSFEATWVERKVSQRTDVVKVYTDCTIDEYAVFVTPIETLDFNFPETLFAYVVKGTSRENDIKLKFKIENVSVSTNYNTWLNKISLVDNGDFSITIEAKGSQMVGKSFDLVAYNTEYDIENRQTITVTSAF